MNCRELSNFLADYVAGELATPTTIEFEAHLLRCRNCDAFLVQYRGTISAGCHAFDQSVLDAMPDDLVEAIMAACAKTRPENR